MKPVDCCSDKVSLHRLTAVPLPFQGRLIYCLQTPYKIKLPTCTRKKLEYQHYRYRQGQQPALASPRRTARYERIPPDGFGVAALEVKLHGKTPPPASLVPLVLSGPLCPAGISPPRGESPLSGEAFFHQQNSPGGAYRRLPPP